MVRKDKKIRKEKKERLGSHVGFHSSFRAFFITSRDIFSTGANNSFVTDIFFVNTFYESLKRGLFTGSLVPERGAKGGSKWNGFSEAVIKESKRERKCVNLTVQVKTGKFNCFN